ncbi:MAG TPA: ABC transporter permease [Chryseosolibacter sp.]
MSKLQKPEFPFRLLNAFCPPDIAEGVEGDLYERYMDDCKAVGERKARRRLLLNVILFFRPAILLRNKFSISLISVIMIRSYFTISFRYLARNKLFSAINVLGLALGMAAALLIFEYVSFERSYDSFHPDVRNIYRVTTEWNKNVTPSDVRATTMPWAGPSVKEALPEVQDYARLTKLDVFTGFNAVHYKDVLANEQDIFLADPGFLRMFGFQLLRGDRTTALNEPTSIVITESSAHKFFGDEDPMGKVMALDSHNNLPESSFKVTGVIQDPPANSHLKFDFLMSFNVIHNSLHNGSTYWHWDYTYCYLKLAPGADPGAVANKMTTLRVSQFRNEMQYYNDVVDFKLQPLTQIHLDRPLKGELSIHNDNRAISFLVVIGACILACAYINYINLATVKAVERKIEIGIRKVVGSSKAQLTMQLLVESFVLNMFAFSLAVLLYFVSIPLLESTFNIQWPAASILQSGKFLAVLALVLSLGIIFSVIYPAFVLTSFKPAQVLKGVGVSVSHRTVTLQRLLLIVQFMFCIAFTIGTYSLHRQLQYMKTFDMGMDIDRVLVVKGYGFEKYNVYEDFKSVLSSSSNVKSIGISSVAPGDEVINLGLRPHVKVAGRSGVPVELKLATIDDAFFETIDVKFASGRNFDKTTKDPHAVIVNEAAARLLGITPRDIVGEKLEGLEEGNVEIVGVIEDYNQRSLQSGYEPMVYFPIWNLDFGWNDRYYFVKMATPANSENVANAIDDVEKAWKSINPGKPFQYFFLDSYFDQQYKAETTNTGLFIFFAAFAIFIACLGLFGLVAYTTLQRTKEIGVRKVLGASIKSILVLLAKDFAWLMLLAAVISVPVMAFGLDQWLHQYAFRIELTFSILGLPVLLIFVIALATVCLKSLKVASSNPIESLRHE